MDPTRGGWSSVATAGQTAQNRTPTTAVVTTTGVTAIRAPHTAAPPTLPKPLAERLPPPVAGALEACLSQLPGGRSDKELEELRLRAGRYVTLTVGGENLTTPLRLDDRDLSDILSALCGGSLYAYSQDIAQGFLTLPDGIRVGVAGRAALENGQVLGLREITGLCIRLPHRHRAVGASLARRLRDSLRAGSPSGLLLYGAPGIGKTTLLRGIATELASPPQPLRTVLVDTRAELCYDTTDPSLCLDVLVGYPRALGVEIATRTLSAQVILCDEIGDCAEAMALTAAHHGGVPLVASAHAATVSELLRRTGMRLFHEARLFSAYIGLTRDGAGGFRYRITTWEQAEAELTGRPPVQGSP